jgi:acetyl esterase/lipase
MKIKFLAIAIVAISIIASCKKDEASGSTTVQASTQLNIAYGAASLQNMDVYLPAGRSTNTTKVMILIHGGAWSLGDKADFTAYVDTLKNRFPTYAIFNINYRLSAFPNNVFPTQEMDTKAAIEFIYNKRNDYLISDKFVLLGASAGAHLALLHAYKYQSPVKIKAVVDFFGPTDMVDIYNNPGVVPQSSVATIVGATPTTNAALYQSSSPINFVTTANACPTIIFQGSADPLVNAVTQSAALNTKLQAMGVPQLFTLYAGKGHGDDWGNDTFFDAFTKIQAFVNTHNP